MRRSPRRARPKTRAACQLQAPQETEQGGGVYWPRKPRDVTVVLRLPAAQSTRFAAPGAPTVVLIDVPRAGGVQPDPPGHGRRRTPVHVGVDNW